MPFTPHVCTQFRTVLRGLVGMFLAVWDVVLTSSG